MSHSNLHTNLGNARLLVQSERRYDNKMADYNITLISGEMKREDSTGRKREIINILMYTNGGELTQLQTGERQNIITQFFNLGIFLMLSLLIYEH